MKKRVFLSVFMIISFANAYAKNNEFTESTTSHASGRPIGTDISENPYDVDKQYEKADQIKKDNRFYNLKDADQEAIVKSKSDKIYSLVDIYKLAKKYNAEFLSAQSKFASNVETVPKALGLLLPSANFNYNLRRDSYTQDNSRNIRDTANSFAFTGSQVLFDWTKWKTYTQATYIQKAYAMMYAKAEQDLINNVVTAYFELLRADQTLRFQFANEAWNKKLYLAQKRKYESGIVSYADLKTSNAQYQQAIADRAGAQKMLIEAKVNMAKLVGKKISSIMYLSDVSSFGSPVPDDINYWIDTAKKYNLDISQKSFEYNASNEGVGIEWGNFFPNVTLDGGTSTSFNNYQGDDQLVDNLAGKFSTANIGGTVKWNLLKGGSDFAKLKKAGYDRQASNYSLLQTERVVYANTVNAFQTVTLDAVKIDAYKKSVYSGLASVKAILEGFEAGTQTIVDLLNRQAILVQAQLAFAGSIFSYIEHYTELKRLQGGLTYKDVALINKLLGDKDVISEIASE